MANETNCFKYWKKNCEIDRDKLIEEIVDCIHFTLSLLNLDEVQGESVYRIIPWYFTVNDLFENINVEDVEKCILSVYSALNNERYFGILRKLVGIAKYYNYTAEEIVQAYDCKYEENIARQKRNY